jgi:hypothetical protein
MQLSAIVRIDPFEFCSHSRLLCLRMALEILLERRWFTAFQSGLPRLLELPHRLYVPIRSRLIR